MLRPTLAIALTLGCAGRAAVSLTSQAETGDETTALQALIDGAAGGVAVIPPGRHVLGPGPAGWSLEVPAGTTLRGAPGAVLVQSPAGPARRLIAVRSSDVVIEDLELDGQRSQQPDQDEHRAGIIALGAERLTIRRVVAHDFTGDGVYLYTSVDGTRAARDVVIDAVVARDNTRNGLTFGGQTERATVIGSTFASNGAQQLDTEAPIGQVNDVTISSSTLDTLGITQQYVLTISGSGPGDDQASRRWRVVGNTINGGINVVWARDVVIAGNRGVNPTSSPWRVYRTSRDVVIDGNDLTSTQTAVPALGAVSIVGTLGGSPRGTRVVRNTLRSVGHVAAVAVLAEGAGDVEIADNTLIGPGWPSPIGAGVLLRATSDAAPFDAAVIRRNRISDWGAVGIAVWGNGEAQIALVDVSDNIFVDTAGTMRAAMSLDFDGARAARCAQQRGNVIVGGVTALVRDPGPGSLDTFPSGDRWTRQP